MTRRNDKRNNRRNRQRNNGNEEASKFASMMMGAIMGKAFEEVFGKNDDEESSGIHAEGISNQDINNINIGKATLSKLRIPADGSAVEYPIPDNLQFFFDEEGKLMVRQKIEGDEKPSDSEEGKPITYGDICRELFYKKDAWYLNHNHIETWVQTSSNYGDPDNCTSMAQVKRLIAFNKLQNIAKYLNDGWKPNFDGHTKNWSINKETNCLAYTILYSDKCNEGGVYFKSEELAKKAVYLMGQESLNDLYSTDW